MDTAIAVLESAGPDDPDAADTVPLRSPVRAIALGSGSRHRRVPARASTHSASEKAVLRGAARSLLVTPWFAAASGFVIAASLWIYSPHAHLQFPNNGNAIQLQHCHSSCSPAGSQKGSGSLAGKGGRLKLAGKSGAARSGPGAHDPGRTAVSGLTFSYYVLPSEHGKFTISISVSGKSAIKDWQLAFVLRGDRIRWVAGANWQRKSRDSGTASGDVQAGQWPGDGLGQGDGQSQGGNSGGDHHQYGFTFLVSGKGSAVGPTSCVYNGRSCTFRTGWPPHSEAG